MSTNCNLFKHAPETATCMRVMQNIKDDHNTTTPFRYTGMIFSSLTSGPSITPG